MFGTPGAGKSYFSKKLSAKLNLVWLNPETAPPDAKTKDLAAVVNQRMLKALASQRSVVLDCTYSGHEYRQYVMGLAPADTIIRMVVWVKTPYKVNMDRYINREANAYQQVPKGNTAREKQAYAARQIKRVTQAMEIPTKAENLIIIDGLKTFPKQYSDFLDSCASHSACQQIRH